MPTKNPRTPRQSKDTATNSLSHSNSKSYINWLSFVTNPRISLAKRLFLFSFLISLLIQPGGVASSDTGHRLQVTHAFWTSAPAVLPTEYPRFGIPGRHGVLQAWYGMGQSIVMLPGDMIGTGLSQAFPEERRDEIRKLIVGLSTFPLLSALGILTAFALLKELGFEERHACLAALGLLTLTSDFHYAQWPQENNLLLLITLLSLWAGCRWIKNSKAIYLLIASAAAGFALLVRLTTVSQVMVWGSFLLLSIFLRPFESIPRRSRVIQLFTIAGTLLAAALLVDRLYHFWRFETFSGTYIHLYGIEARRQNPSLPVNYPFNLPFRVGFLGALFSIHKSIFLFDPVFALAIFLMLGFRRRIGTSVVILVSLSLVDLLATISFYARYSDWGGDSAWGDRFCSVPVQLTSLLGLAVLAQHWTDMKKFNRYFLKLLLVLVLFLQLSSLILNPNVEVSQWVQSGKPSFVVGQRWLNLFALASGKFSQWGLDNNDYLHTPEGRTLNFLPFRIAAKLPATLALPAESIWFLASIYIAILGLQFVGVLSQQSSLHSDELVPMNSDIS
jgi:hypothetical protein